MLTELRVLIAVPTAGMVPMGFTYSLVNLISHHAAFGIPTRKEAKVTLGLQTIQSSCIHSNREQLAAAAVSEGYTHLMFLDDDMTFHQTILEIMLGRRQPVVVTNYLVKSHDPQFVAIGLDEKRVITSQESTGTIPVIYSGFGASLFEIEVFKKTPQPWFQTIFDAPANAYTTEDFAFFERVRGAGFDVLLDQDASKLLGHIGRKAWQWDEYKAPKVELVKGESRAEQKTA
jgi:hypothetical protein